VSALLLLLAPASGQDIDNCTLDEAYPMAGTSGLENALSALRINAQTYSATEFAEEHVFPVWEEVRRDIAATDETEALPLFFKVAYENNANLGVATLPMWHQNADCPEAYRFSTSPVDLYASNLGFVFRAGRLGVYYSAAFTFGYAAVPQQANRFAMWIPMTLITGYGSVAAPLAGGGAQIVDGGSAFSVDWLGGGVYDGKLLKARGGYARSRGLHGSIHQPQTGLFARGVLRGDGWTDIEQYTAGAEEVDLGRVSETIGRPSAFARGVPLTGRASDDDEQDTLQLRSGHVRQTDIAGVLDIEVAWATAPQPLLHEVWVAWHSPQFSEPGRALVDRPVASRVGGGMLQMPAQFYYGLDQRRLVTARYDVLAQLGERRGTIRFSAAYNDPAQLLIFPFARDALSVTLGVEGEF